MKVMKCKEEQHSVKMDIAKDIGKRLSDLRAILEHIENGPTKTSAILAINSVGRAVLELQDIIHKEATE